MLEPAAKGRVHVTSSGPVHAAVALFVKSNLYLTSNHFVFFKQFICISEVITWYLSNVTSPSLMQPRRTVCQKEFPPFCTFITPDQRAAQGNGCCMLTFSSPDKRDDIHVILKITCDIRDDLAIKISHLLVAQIVIDLSWYQDWSLKTDTSGKGRWL